MERLGYVFDISLVFYDVDEVIKVNWVCGYSERLVISYFFIYIGEGVLIRVIKNLRVCGDCYKWMKIVS